MLTHIQTPRVLIPHIYAPDTYQPEYDRSGRGATTRYSVTFEISPETEADLPAYIRERINEASTGWHGVPKGTRFLNVSCGLNRPAVFGVSTDNLLWAQATNTDPDQMFRDRPATICVSMGRKTGRDAGTWPILRAIYTSSLNLPMAGFQGYHAYAAERAAHWEFPE